jgi:aspartate 1-decarboxylase
MEIEILSQGSPGRDHKANLNYIGSLTLDEDLMDAANMIANEKLK